MRPETKRKDVFTSVLSFGFNARMKHSFFNNLEEAKRIESLLRGFDAGLYCIQDSQQCENSNMVA
jgi:hypothetical protein